MKCTHCKKDVEMTTAAAALKQLSIDVIAGELNLHARILISRSCSFCGGRMKEVLCDGDSEVLAIHNNSCEWKSDDGDLPDATSYIPEIVYLKPTTQTVAGDRIGPRGVAMPKTLYGFELEATATCSACQHGAVVRIADSVAASQMYRIKAK